MNEVCSVCEADLSVVKWDGIEMDYDSHILLIDGRLVDLQPNQFEVFLLLHDNFSQGVTRDQIFDELYSDVHEDSQPELKIIDVYISHIRRALEGTKAQIDTVWGRGYKLTFNEGKKISIPEFVEPVPKEKSSEVNPHTGAALAVAQTRKTKKKSAGVIKFSEDLGALPEFGYIPLNAIVVDSNYQRAINSKHARNIAENFHWDKFQPITLAPVEGGKYAVIDGQHRWYAARLHPLVDKVPAYIVELPDVVDQAQAFVATNAKRLGINAVNIYWASLTAGRSDYINVHSLLETEGLSVVPNLGYKGPNQVSAIITVLAIYRRDGAKVLREVLSLLKRMFPEEENAFKAIYLKGMKDMRLVYGDKMDEETLLKAMEGLSPDTLDAYARDLKLEIKESLSAKLFCELLRRKYNEAVQAESPDDYGKFLPAIIEEGKKGKQYYRAK